MQQHPANLGKARSEPFENFCRRRDRIGGGEANTTADGAERSCFVAREQPSAGGSRTWRGESLVEIDGRRSAKSDLDAGEAGLDGDRPLVGETGLDRSEDLLGGKAQQAACDAERDHVGAAFGNGLGQVLHRHVDDAGANLGHHRRRLAAAGVADHQGLRSDLDFGAETVGV